MTDFAEYEPAQWIEDVFLVPVKPRSAGTGKRKLVRDALFPIATAVGALLVTVQPLPPAWEVHAVADFAVTEQASVGFAEPSEGDIDPRIWAHVAEVMAAAPTVEVERDFEDEPEPFI